MSAKSRAICSGGFRYRSALAASRRPACAQRHVLADRREHVEERPLVGRGESHAAGGDHRHAERLGQPDEHVVVVFLIAPQMPLELDVQVRSRPKMPTSVSSSPPTPKRSAWSNGRPASAMRPSTWPSRSASESAPSPFGARSFIVVIRRHRFCQPVCDETRTGKVNLVI